jgi:predicted nucleotidyltransferase
MTHVFQTIKKNAAMLKQKYGLARLGVFGSQVEGEAKLNSDIDVIYETIPGKRFTFKEFLLFENELKIITGVQDVDLVNAKYINPFVADSAEKTIIYV